MDFLAEKYRKNLSSEIIKSSRSALLTRYKPKIECTMKGQYLIIMIINVKVLHLTNKDKLINFLLTMPCANSTLAKCKGGMT